MEQFLSGDDDLLLDFHKLAKDNLIRANEDRRHPFRLCTLCTVNNNVPYARTVVKRHTMSDLTTLIYTDARSKKVVHLRINNVAALLFYHPKLKLQISMKVAVELIESGETFEKHKEIALRNPNDYSTLQAPGICIDHDLDYEYADEEHFVLLKSKPIELDILQLSEKGHRRAVFKEGVGYWVVP